MFNEYEVHQLIKLRQEETERNARDAWRSFIHPAEMKESKIVTTSSNPSYRLLPLCLVV